MADTSDDPYQAFRDLAAAVLLGAGSMPVPVQPPADELSLEQRLIEELDDRGFTHHGEKSRQVWTHPDIVSHGEERKLTLLQAIDLLIASDRLKAKAAAEENAAE